MSTSGSGRDYVQLSSGSFIKRFKAIELRMPMTRTDSIDWTVGGKIDKASGHIIQELRYQFRIPLDIPGDANYGCYDDLVYLYGLTHPPNDVITLYDHFNQLHYVYFAGTLDPQSMTTMIDGPSAYFLAPIQFVEIPQ